MGVTVGAQGGQWWHSGTVGVQEDSGGRGEQWRAQGDSEGHRTVGAQGNSGGTVEQWGCRGTVGAEWGVQLFYTIIYNVLAMYVAVSLTLESNTHNVLTNKSEYCTIINKLTRLSS